MKNHVIILSGNGNKTLSENICTALNLQLGEMLVTRFSDSETRVKIKDNVRGKDVFVIQPTSTPANENLMELLIIIDALKRASAGRITAVIPYFGYARQDRKDQPRVPITAKLVANLLTIAGASRVLTLDLHAGQIQGFFDIPVDHIYAVNVFVEYLKKHKKPLTDNLVIVSPDVGGIKMARAYAKKLSAGLAIVDKRRVSPESIEVMHILGEVEGKNAILVDDIIATGSSLVEAAEVLKNAGSKKIMAIVTHGILSADAVQKLEKSAIDTLFITDSIPLPENKKHQKIKVITVSELFAEAIKRIHLDESISILFDNIN